ncbi:endonuclease/exonuclease/phosphatase family protein [Streptomyces sp. NPDC087218]|uniref:endonuclease/exonuclease/phosphatase family protein n=1 Tax=Streptomyces sp. NPDC087218 TaxID=3365769 RepID=UPI0038197EA9
MAFEDVPAGKEEGVLRIVTYNLCGGGLDRRGLGAVDTMRWEQQIILLLLLRPDVVCLQEATHYDRDNFTMAEATGQALGMEWHLTPSNSRGSLMTLVNPRRLEVGDFVPVAAEGEPRHTLARADLTDRVTGWKLTVFNAHLDPLSSADRAREIALPAEYGTRNDVLLVGNLGSEEPDGTYAGSERRALDALIHAGFRDPVRHLGVPWARTAGYWSPDEQHDLRSDYVLLGRGAGPRLKDFRVLDMPETREVSNHLPCYVDVASAV